MRFFSLSLFLSNLNLSPNLFCVACTSLTDTDYLLLCMLQDEFRQHVEELVRSYGSRDPRVRMR